MGSGLQRTFAEGASQKRPYNGSCRIRGLSQTKRVWLNPFRMDASREIAIRLGAALLLGSILGLNRDLHGNPAGLRTHAMVSLGAAIATIIGLGIPDELKLADPNPISRVLQGILTGIGFLGAGVIMRHSSGHVSGLTTAATVWVCAALGAACGLGYWKVVIISSGLIAVVLGIGGPIERLAERLFKRRKSRGSPQTGD